MTRSRREEAAVAVFGTWMLTGLFIDGWAHGVDKPETFFSPWHGILYSGFVAALLWFAVEGIRENRRGEPQLPAPKLTILGLVIFIAGAVGDGAWHEIFGIEVDIEALLSPTHLMLLIGGFLMLTTPLRAAYADTTETRPRLREFAPQIVTLTLAVALIGFFTMYVSVFDGVGVDRVGDADLREQLEALGIGSVLVTNLLLLVPLTWVLGRWHPPLGTFTILFGGFGVMMSGLEGFDAVELAVAPLLGGLLADVLVRRNLSTTTIATAVPLVVWPAYFAIADASYGLMWSVDLWAGCIVLTCMSGLLLSRLMRPPPLPSAPVPDSPPSEAAATTPDPHTATPQPAARV